MITSCRQCATAVQTLTCDGKEMRKILIREHKMRKHAVKAGMGTLYELKAMIGPSVPSENALGMNSQHKRSAKSLDGLRRQTRRGLNQCHCQ